MEEQDLHLVPQKDEQLPRKPFRQLGQWLDGANDSSVVILSSSKELALFMKKRTVVVVDVFVSLERFEQIIRDYGIHYLVVASDNYGWRELEMQMVLTDRYSFQEEYSAGNYAVYSTHPAKRSGLPRNSFEALLRMIKRGDFRTVDSVYYLNKAIFDSHMHLFFLEAITKESLGQLDIAQLMMERMYTVPQGIVYSQEAGFHRALIERRQQMNASHDVKFRAQLSTLLAASYWECDLRWLALSFIHQSIAGDSDYVLPYFYGIVFSLAIGDTGGGRQILTALQQRNPDKNMVHSFTDLFSVLDSLRDETKYLSASRLYFRLANEYKYLTLVEYEITALIDGLSFDPSNVSMLERLAVLYESKERYFPALRAWRKAESIAPSAMIQEKIREIEKRY
jgi:tetratricopeptide (TPR) repeat protein